MFKISKTYSAMSIFEEGFRTIATRKVILSKKQMENFRIKNIFNSIGNPEYLNDSDAEKMLGNFIERGEFCLLEAISEEEIYIISLLTFEDIWSRNMFALMHFEYYDGFPDLITLYN